MNRFLRVLLWWHEWRSAVWLSRTLTAKWRADVPVEVGARVMQEFHEGAAREVWDALHPPVTIQMGDVDVFADTFGELRRDGRY